MELDYNKLLDMVSEMGYRLMKSGAEIYRVEESVRRLLTAYGLQPQVFAIPNCLIVSFNTPTGHPITQMRRIPAHGTDIELLERCNDLCRRLCQEVPPLEEAKAQVDALEKERHLYPGWVFLLGYAAASGFFAAFFGGDLLDSRTLDLHIQRLRKKLGWADKIETVYRVGYRLKSDQK